MDRVKKLSLVPIDNLRPGKYQPRKKFDSAKLSILADSIKQNGLIQPIAVRPVVGGFEILAGERRWRACQQIGLDSVEVTIQETDDQTAAAISLTENLQRENLTLMEEARGLARLRLEFNIGDSQIADAVGRSRTDVCRMIGLTTLPAKIQQLLDDEVLSYGHGKLLIPLSEMLQLQMGLRATSRGWSVRWLNKAIVEANKPQQKNKSSMSDNTAEMLSQGLGEKLQTPVSVQWTPGKPQMQVTIKTWGSEGLQGVIERLSNMPDQAGKGAAISMTFDAEHFDDLDWLW